MHRKKNVAVFLMFKRVTHGSANVFTVKKERLAPPPQRFEGRTPSVPERHVDGFAGVFSAGQSKLPTVVGLSNSEENRRLQKIHGENLTLRVGKNSFSLSKRTVYPGCFCCQVTATEPADFVFPVLPVIPFMNLKQLLSAGVVDQQAGQ